MYIYNRTVHNHTNAHYEKMDQRVEEKKGRTESKFPISCVAERWTSLHYGIHLISPLRLVAVAEKLDEEEEEREEQKPKPVLGYFQFTPSVVTNLFMSSLNY